MARNYSETERALAAYQNKKNIFGCYGLLSRLGIKEVFDEWILENLKKRAAEKRKRAGAENY